MGYRCPVCDEPQLDGVQLANHLAFTAMIRSETHEEWLDEHVTDWRELRPEGLAEEVTSHVPEEDLPGELEAAANDYHERVPDRERGEGAYSERRRETPNLDRGELSDEAADVMAEARAMTRKMHERADPSGEAADDSETASEADDDRDPADDPDGNA
jgi:hypothetical protein